MKPTEKILSGVNAILLLLVIVLGYQYSNVKDSIGEKEAILNDIHDRQIKMYDNHIDTLLGKISTLQSENEALTKQKQRVKIVTIREIDSISRLPFDGKAEFFAREITRIDSTRIGYVGNGN